MMNYLSSELESTNFGHHDAAAAALQSTTSGGDENASSDVEKKSVTNGDVVIMSTKKDKNEEEKIYTEITKLTRSTVDRYVGLIFTINVGKESGNLILCNTYMAYLYIFIGTWIRSF